MCRRFRGRGFRRRRPFEKVFGDNFFYILYSRSPDRPTRNCRATRPPPLSAADGPGVSDDGAGAQEYGTGPESSSIEYREPPALPEWIGQDEFDHYVTELTRTGFRPLNSYRCSDSKLKLTATPPAATIAIPSLFMAGTADQTFAYTPHPPCGEGRSPVTIRDMHDRRTQDTGSSGSGPAEVDATLLDSLRIGAEMTRPLKLGCSITPFHPSANPPRSLWNLTWSGWWPWIGWVSTKPGSASITRRLRVDRLPGGVHRRRGRADQAHPARHRRGVAALSPSADGGQPVGALDHLTRGRVMFGTGPGALPSDAYVMGIDPSSSGG